MNIRKHAVFLVLTAVIVVSDSLFIVLNFQADKLALNNHLSLVSQRTIAMFELAYESSFRSMLMLATYVANDQNVLQHFRDGQQAVLAEGGGKGGPEAARHRRALLDSLSTNWRALTERFAIRQLHFHIGPGDTSFLRVHEPSKFGDDLSRIRHTVADAIRHGQVVTGFESGRVYSGLRAVVPLFSEDPQNTEAIGAVETGISFALLMDQLKQRSGQEFAVLLSTDYMQTTLWPEFLDRLFQDAPPVRNYYIEYTTAPMIEKILNAPSFSSSLRSHDVPIVNIDEKNYALTTIPLRDYLGQKRPSRPDSGLIVAWRNIDEEIQAFQETTRQNILFGVAAFVVLEVILFLVIRVTLKGLHNVVERQTRHLYELNKALQMKNEYLDSFTRTVSHDLKNPLTSIIGYTKCLKMDELSGESRKQFIDRILFQSERMERIIQGYLLYARTEKQHIGYAPVALDDVLREARSSVEYLLDSSGGVIRLPETSISIRGNKELLIQLFANLFSNSMKYRRPGIAPEVCVRINEDYEHVVIEVQDNGIGIEDGKHEELFREFHRVHDPSLGVEGTGIGLTTVKRIVERHFGHIDFFSEVGVGTTFFIALPKSDTGRQHHVPTTPSVVENSSPH